jgi:hypothetical protein
MVAGCHKALQRFRALSLCPISNRRRGTASVASVSWGAGQRRVAMNDAQRCRMNAAECLSAAERCGQPYRRLTLSIAETWLSLARHEEAMDALLGIRSVTSTASSRQQNAAS